MYATICWWSLKAECFRVLIEKINEGTQIQALTKSKVTVPGGTVKENMGIGLKSHAAVTYRRVAMLKAIPIRLDRCMASNSMHYPGCDFSRVIHFTKLMPPLDVGGLNTHPPPSKLEEGVARVCRPQG